MTYHTIRKKFVVLLLLILFINLYFSINRFPVNHNYYKNINVDTNTHLNEIQSELPCKVYTFCAPNDTVIFRDIILETSYLYYITIELVTENYVSSMRVRLWDPDMIKYDIFQNILYWTPESYRSFKFPFGTALSGNYSIEFNALTSKNVNILIKIEKGPPCMYDRIDTLNNIIFYNTIRFQNKVCVEQIVHLNTDINYQVIYGRVSPISAAFNNTIYASINMTDPLGVQYEITKNELMENLDGINGFYFGTAKSGLYSIRMNLSCQVDYINVGLALIEDRSISDVIDSNKTSSNLPDIFVFFPIEGVIFMLGFLGSCILMALLVIYFRNRNSIDWT